MCSPHNHLFLISSLQLIYQLGKNDFYDVYSGHKKETIKAIDMCLINEE